jgi:hypothetical protein
MIRIPLQPNPAKDPIAVAVSVPESCGHHHKYSGIRRPLHPAWLRYFLEIALLFLRRPHATHRMRCAGPRFAPCPAGAAAFSVRHRIHDRDHYNNKSLSVFAAFAAVNDP